MRPVLLHTLSTTTTTYQRPIPTGAALAGAAGAAGVVVEAAAPVAVAGNGAAVTVAESAGAVGGRIAPVQARHLHHQSTAGHRLECCPAFDPLDGRIGSPAMAWCQNNNNDSNKIIAWIRGTHPTQPAARLLTTLPTLPRAAHQTAATTSP